MRVLRIRFVAGAFLVDLSAATGLIVAVFFVAAFFAGAFFTGAATAATFLAGAAEAAETVMIGTSNEADKTAAV